MEIFYFFRTQRQSFLLVVFLQVIYMLDGLRLDIYRKDILVKPLVHPL